MLIGNTLRIIIVTSLKDIFEIKEIYEESRFI